MCQLVVTGDFVRNSTGVRMAKILIVDDSAYARARLEQVITNGGHEIAGSAANGRDAMALYAKLNPELVTLDYIMRGMSGEDTLKELIAMDASAKVIVISGFNDPDLETRMMRAGALGFVEKFDLDKNLVSVIDQALD